MHQNLLVLLSCNGFLQWVLLDHMCFIFCVLTPRCRKSAEQIELNYFHKQGLQRLLPISLKSFFGAAGCGFSWAPCGQEANSPCCWTGSFWPHSRHNNSTQWHPLQDTRKDCLPCSPDSILANPSAEQPHSRNSALSGSARSPTSSCLPEVTSGPQVSRCDGGETSTPDKAALSSHYAGRGMCGCCLICYR